MFEQVRDHLKEIIEIADICPEPYRECCFSILLEHTLGSLFPPVEVPHPRAPVMPAEVLEGKVGERLSKFVSEHKLSDAEIREVFHVEPDRCEIIVRDLKAKATSDKQVHLALLLGVKHLATNNASVVPGSELRELCAQYACLDSKNFASNMKRQRNLFLKKDKDWRLTQPGLSKAAEVIKQLAGLVGD